MPMFAAAPPLSRTTTRTGQYAPDRLARAIAPLPLARGSEETVSHRRAEARLVGNPEADVAAAAVEGVPRGDDEHARGGRPASTDRQRVLRRDETKSVGTDDLDPIALVLVASVDDLDTDLIRDLAGRQHAPRRAEAAKDRHVERLASSQREAERAPDQDEQ